MFETITPIDGSVYHKAQKDGPKAIDEALKNAQEAKEAWAGIKVEDRAKMVKLWVDAVYANSPQIAEEITWQMGRPLSQSPGELNGFRDRAEYMIGIAEEALQPYEVEDTSAAKRWLERIPLGIVAVLSPWNYPLLTSVNAIVPALLAGNTVILKHSFQTPLVAEQYHKAAQQVGLPKGVFQILHLDHKDAANLVADTRIGGVFFTGSVTGGVAIQNSLKNRFIPCGLELGGKDPAYVRPDANLEHTVENLVDGAFFNSGQSCCGIERIYVHETLYKSFVEGFVELTKQYRLGNPLDISTNLGPMVKTSAADFVRQQIKQALDMGARSLIDEAQFKASKKGTPYLSPHVLVDVNHKMDIMSEESFGPVIGIMQVKNDTDAVKLMNDSQYGLTASLWTEDRDVATAIANQLETGTVFMNRCDYLDPALAWTGVKNSGRGVTLSKVGFEHVTRVKSFNFRG